MARALLGHLATSADHLLLAENARLRRRIADLEAQVAELHAAQEYAADDAELHAELAQLHALAEERTREQQTEPV